MSIRSRSPRFDRQPPTELATGGQLEIEDRDDEKRVVLEPDGVELKRWSA